MQRLIKEGKIKPKSSLEIKKSRVGLGFEKLDRDVFDPEKAYDKVCELGIKWARIQSGWHRTEREKGVYNFDWIDSVIDNFVKRGIEPWVCLCYGNDLYTEIGKEYLASVGCPPIHSNEEKNGWENYVKAFVSRYRGKVTYYEIWNEPDSDGMWRSCGSNATEYGNFVIATAKAVKEANENAKVIAGSIFRRELTFINQAFKTGMGDYIDYITFHEYTPDETKVFERAKTLKAIADKYNDKIQIIQGESGSQSKHGGWGALWRGAWTEEKQAKQLARHTIADLMTDVFFMSYFSCMDMNEAFASKKEFSENKKIEYAYFGVLGAEIDENGKSVGEYYKKPSYFTLQNIASVFSEDCKTCELPVIFTPEHSWRIYETDTGRNKAITGGFAKENGEALAYWYPSNILTTSFEGTISLQVYSEYDKVRLVDIMDGSIYEIPESIMSRDEFGLYTFKHLPIKDTPLLLTFGEF